MKIVPFRSSPENAVERQHVAEVLVAILDSLYSTSVRMTGNAQAAEDLVQEASRKVVQSARMLRERRNIRAWIFKVLLNSIRDYLRRQKLWREVDLDAGDSDFTVSPVATAMHDVRKALARLAPPLRAVVLLIDIEEFTISEAAGILKIPPGTAASRLARAHRELREQLGAYRAKVPREGGVL
ncbi:MAG: RNA polymerase sigma factor [Acidobacteria bacterium]|nr:RNA polymerase sigma factor [Acidobacteriota bacterium]